MKALFGFQFDRQWQGWETQELINSFCSHLKDFSLDELVRGYKSLAKLKYAPTLAEFMQLCRPDVDPVSAYYEAVRGLQERRAGRKGEWSHPSIFWAASSMAHDLLNMSQSQVEKRWKSALEKEFQKTVWQAVPDVPVALNLTPDKAGQEKVRQKVNEFLSHARNDRGNKDWIHNNLKRLAEGWKPTAAVRKMVLNAARMKDIQIPQGVI